MIGKLKGVVDGIDEDHALIDVYGVGYLVQASSRTLQGVHKDAAVTLFIETQVREDAIRLFGFLTEAEREWFRLLQTVQGVGAKVALSILGTLKPGELASAIAISDKASIRRAPGVGPKVEKLFARLLGRAEGQTRVVDLLFHLPSSIIDRRARPKLRDVIPGTVVTVAVTIDRHRPAPLLHYLLR